MYENVIENHPLPPFLPAGARLLMLGSFPPPLKRWSMEFYYPNLQNDMWRVFGLVFFNDRDYFTIGGRKEFSKEKLTAFLSGKGIALFDTAVKVVRRKGNASDDLLDIVETVDLKRLLDEIPMCRNIVTTGGKAAETLISITGSACPPVGGSCEFDYAGRTLRHYRMPSTSRAYPKPLADKASAYGTMFRETGIL